MQFTNTFAVDAPIDDVYAAMLDIERVAPCVPGAQGVERLDGDVHRVSIRVRVGPMTMQYRADVEIVERDVTAHRAVMRAKAKEIRGGGTADADVRMELTDRGGATEGTLTSDVSLKGKVAAMGQGVIGEVAARLLEQFTANLATMLAGDQAPQSADVGAEPASPSPDGASGDGELNAVSLAVGVVGSRLQDPRVLTGTLAGVAGVAFLLGRASRR